MSAPVLYRSGQVFGPPLVEYSTDRVVDALDEEALGKLLGVDNFASKPLCL